MSGGLVHLVVFRIEGDRYAVRSDHVDRVLERVTIEPLPWLPSTVAGVLRLDDEWLAVIDPAAALGTAERAHMRSTVLVLRRGGLRYGLAADLAMGRRELRAHRLQDGEASRTVTRFEDLEGVEILSDDDGLITVLDPDGLFKAEAREVVEQTRRRDWTGAGTASIVAFRAGGADLGLHVGQVSEVLPYRAPETMESTHDGVLGSITIRDRRVPLLDLARLFGLAASQAPAERGEAARILVVEVAGERYGLVVDEVSDVTRVPADDITAAPRFLRRVARGSIDAVARIDDRLVLLLRLDDLMTVAAAPRAAPTASASAGGGEAGKAAKAAKPAKPVKPVKAAKPAKSTERAAKPGRKPRRKKE